MNSDGIHPFFLCTPSREGVFLLSLVVVLILVILLILILALVILLILVILILIVVLILVLHPDTLAFYFAFPLS